jgi:chromosome segregation ATPase
MDERRARIASIDAERVELDLRLRELQRRSDENSAGMDEVRRALGGLMEKEKQPECRAEENRTALAMLAETVQELYDRDNRLRLLYGGRAGKARGSGLKRSKPSRRRWRRRAPRSRSSKT